VLAISARTDAGLEARCLGLDFRGFLRKPCSVAELAAALRPLLPQLSRTRPPAPPQPVAAT